MSIFCNHFPLGLGTSRFPISGPNDTQGIEKSIQLVCKALDSGVSYVDVGYIYSAGMAPIVLGAIIVIWSLLMRKRYR